MTTERSSRSSMTKDKEAKSVGSKRQQAAGRRSHLPVPAVQDGAAAQGPSSSSRASVVTRSNGKSPGRPVEQTSSRTFTKEEQKTATAKLERRRRVKRKFKFIQPVRTMLRNRNRNRTSRRRKAGRWMKVTRGGRHSHDDVDDEFSTASDEEDDDEEDVVRYGPGAYEDLSRYEMARAARLPPSYFADPEANGDQQEPITKKARRVWFFRNGDEHSRAKQVVISHKNFPNFETLLVHLGHLLPTVAGVRYVFKWPDGKEVNSVTEFENGCFYVCSSVRRFQRERRYGRTDEQYWKGGGGKLQHLENHLFTDRTLNHQQQQQVSSSPQQGRQKPYVMTVVSNLSRDTQEKVFLNPNTSQNFEDFLVDLANMVHVPYPPVRAIFTMDKSRVKVEGFSHLFRLLKEQKTYLVCGEERVPIEPKKRPLPSSDSSTNSSVRSKGSNPRHQKHSKGGDLSPNRRMGANRTAEPIRCEINGKKREFMVPSSLLAMESDGTKPYKKFKLNWAYGFRGHDVRQNLVILPKTEELVYFVASVVVLYDRERHTQRHYMGHTEEVTCLALHPHGPFIASGQMAGKTPEGAAHVRVWNAETLNIISVIGIGAFQGGVSCVSFSANQGLLLAIDDSDRHVMTLWEWGEDEDKPLAQTKTTQDPVVYGCFFPFNESILITFGKQHLYFWKVFRDRVDGPIRRDTKSGLFEEETPKFVTSVCFSSDGDVITGDSRGSIMVWKPDDEDIFRISPQASESMSFAHKKSVSSLVMLSDDILLSGGGSEIKAWDGKRDFILIIERLLPQVHGAVRKIVPITSTGVDGHMFVGTTRDVILEGTLQSKFRVVVQGHSEELWAVQSHPMERSFFTAGHDKTLVKWSALNHRVAWITRAKTPYTSMSVDPRGLLVALGSATGSVTLYGAGDGKERNVLHVGKAQVNALSFSPDGKQLAVGCHDGFVHVCAVHGDAQVSRMRSAPLGHNNTFVMHLDWSSDGRYLQTVLGDYDLVFWDVSNMQKVKTTTFLRDAHWHTFSCPVGYPLVGPWRKLKRGEVINVACRSKDLDLIVTGDSVGRVRLYKYPSTAQQPDCQQVKPFSSNVTATEFLYGDSGVVIAGGSDAALMQYDLEDR